MGIPNRVVFDQSVDGREDVGEEAFDGGRWEVIYHRCEPSEDGERLVVPVFLWGRKKKGGLVGFEQGGK